MLFVIHGHLSVTHLDGGLEVVDRGTAMVEDFKDFLVGFLFFPLILLAFDLFVDFVIVDLITLFSFNRLLSAVDLALHVSLLELRVLVFKDTHAVFSKEEVSLTEALESVSETEIEFIEDGFTLSYLKSGHKVISGFIQKSLKSLSELTREVRQFEEVLAKGEVIVRNMVL